MGRHVVGTLDVVPVGMLARRQPIERIGQVAQHIGIGILLNGQRGRGVPDEQRQQAVCGPDSPEPLGDVLGDVAEAGPRSLNG